MTFCQSSKLARITETAFTSHQLVLYCINWCYNWYYNWYHNWYYNWYHNWYYNWHYSDCIHIASIVIVFLRLAQHTITMPIRTSQELTLKHLHFHISMQYCINLHNKFNHITVTKSQIYIFFWCFQYMMPLSHVKYKYKMSCLKFVLHLTICSTLSKWTFLQFGKSEVFSWKKGKRGVLLWLDRLTHPRWSPNSTDLYFWYLNVNRQIQKT